ncbi:MAG: hypothetical protein UY03_C0005G0003 [Parcubacteria group bacterium GW2011_GWA2_47_64]|nr:MAG: hypothetical protein UY03_C0005G0003 [Parcubacteria group bacterium GW2011_GWA2_47_64]KKU96701.1 MAG: hypothetical protein UY29_C0008G0029 [Parcubacteria group bacterium GW2011_GWC2_48_17]
MAYRRTAFTPGEHYHLYNRGNNKQEVFHNEGDYIRFLFYLLYYQSPLTFSRLSEKVSNFKRSEEFGTPVHVHNKIISKRTVALVGFCLMPNHFHLVVQETEGGGISKYMQRVLNGYSKYANKKYPERHIGHVFQGPFKAVHQKTNEQLLYLSAYVHRNPRELTAWTDKERQYPWSSFRDLSGQNRWDTLLLHAVISKQFKGGKDYEKFVNTSSAKSEYRRLLLDNEIFLEAGLEQEEGEVIV